MTGKGMAWQSTARFDLDQMEFSIGDVVGTKGREVLRDAADSAMPAASDSATAAGRWDALNARHGMHRRLRPH